MSMSPYYMEISETDLQRFIDDKNFYHNIPKLKTLETELFYIEIQTILKKYYPSSDIDPTHVLECAHQYSPENYEDHYTWADEVKRLNTYLQTVSSDELMQHVEVEVKDPAFYGYHDAQRDWYRPFMLKTFNELKAFYQEVANNGNAILMRIG